MNKSLTFFKKNYFYIFFSFICFIVCIFTFKLEIDSHQLNELIGNYKYVGVIIIFFLSLLITFGVIIAYRKKIKPETLFLLFVIPIGLLYMVIIPLGRVPDENAHFYRAYEISSGNFISSKNNDGYGGDYLPSNISKAFDGKTTYSEEFNSINIKPSKELSFITFTNTALYSFITYIPQVIGISIGRLFDLSILWIAFLGRLSNFLVWTFLMYYSIKFIPFRKISLLIFMFMPMMIQEAASLSADAITNGSVFFFISYILYLKYTKKGVLSRTNKLIIFLSTVIMSVCKIVYLPLCLLVFLIPNKIFSNKKQKYLQIGLLALIVVLVNLFFFLLSISYNAHVETTEVTNIDTVLQLKYIFQHPITYVIVMFRTIYDYFGMYASGFVGESLCWYDVTISNFLVRIISLILIVVTLFDSGMFEKRDKILSVVSMLLVILLIFTSEYLTWTDVGSFTIQGIQGRYFIPLVVPFLVLVHLKELKYDFNKLFYYLFLMMLFVNISVLVTLFVAHI